MTSNIFFCLNTSSILITTVSNFVVIRPAIMKLNSLEPSLVARMFVVTIIWLQIMKGTSNHTIIV